MGGLGERNLILLFVKLLYFDRLGVFRLFNGPKYCDWLTVLGVKVPYLDFGQECADDH